MRILVTGGAGFIGSHLCKRLVENGDEVICMDNLFTGSLENIEELRKYDNFTFMKYDIVEEISLGKYLDIGKLDQIYNLACPASPPHYQYDPIHTLETNFVGMKNMLDLAKGHNAKILQTSTSEAYGEPLVHPQPETYRGNVNTMGIRACYDEGKRVTETLCYEYRRTYGVDTKVVRIFNTYGPNMNPEDGRVVSNFICQALRDEDITIYGDGSQTRSFCYVDDLVEGLIRMMNSTESGPINLGNPGEFTIKELAEKVIEKIGTTAQIVYKDLPSDDPTKRKPDITKAKNCLCWEPTIKLDEGLDKTIPYFRKAIKC